MKLIVKPNTKYTCSTENKSGNTVYFGQNLDMGVEENGGSLTAISDENGYLYIWILSDRASYDEYTKGTKWIQIEEGEVATDFESYVNNIEYTISVAPAAHISCPVRALVALMYGLHLSNNPNIAPASLRSPSTVPVA